MQFDLRIVALVLLAVSGQYGCAHAPTVKADPCFGPGTIDVQEFGDFIDRRLNGAVIGYGFAISEGGAATGSGQGGFAQMPVLDNGIPFTSLTDIQVASVSKPITAIAVLQLMEKLGVGPDDPISDFLPKSWTKGEGFDSDGITFDDLLSHQTGFDQAIAVLSIALGDELPSPNTWEGLQLIVAEGIPAEVAASECPTKGDDGETIVLGGPAEPDEDHYGFYCYKNANYALARELIWRMALEAGDLSADDDEDEPLKMPEASASGYQKYVQTHVLAPAGVTGTCTATETLINRSLMYDIEGFVPFEILTAGIDAYSDPESDLLGCGPFNWSLSAMDLVRVMGELSCGGLLSDESKKLMRTRKMGFSRDSNSDRYWHSGKWTQSRSSVAQALWPLHPRHPANDPGASAEDCQDNGVDLVCPAKGPSTGRIRTCVVEFTLFGVDAALVLNSDIRTEPDIGACTVLREAFDELF